MFEIKDKEFRGKNYDGSMEERGDSDYPMWLYSEDGESELVNSDEQKNEFLESGWKESPADFFGKKEEKRVGTLDREGLIKFAENRLGFSISRRYSTENMRKVVRNKLKELSLAEELEKEDFEDGEGDNDN